MDKAREEKDSTLLRFTRFCFGLRTKQLMWSCGYVPGGAVAMFDAKSENKDQTAELDGLCSMATIGSGAAFSNSPPASAYCSETASRKERNVWVPNPIILTFARCPRAFPPIDSGSDEPGGDWSE